MARTVNDLFNDTVFPTTERFARWMDNKMGTGTLSQFGAVSSVLNADVSGSAQGPGVALPGAGVRAYASLAALAALAWKAGKGSATLQDVYEYTQKAPPTIRAAGEWLRKYGDTTAQADRLKKGEPRTMAEQVKMKALGLRGINQRLLTASLKKMPPTSKTSGPPCLSKSRMVGVSGSNNIFASCLI
jgi:hypothetical protein